MEENILRIFTGLHISNEKQRYWWSWKKIHPNLITLITPPAALEIQRKRLTQRKGIKILSLKQMLERLKVPAGNTFQNLMNEIRQIGYSNQVYNNNLIKWV